MSETWMSTVPRLSHFAQVADPTNYVPLPDDWHLGGSDVIGSTAAIAAGRYKAVNLAGAATVSAVANALEGDLPLFAFGGDGARFAVSPDQADVASDALSRAAAWAKRDLGLELRVGMTRVAEARAAGVPAHFLHLHAAADGCADLLRIGDQVVRDTLLGGERIGMRIGELHARESVVPRGRFPMIRYASGGTTPP